MKIGKQTLSALALVVSLGLLVPTSFGGPAAADVDNSRGHNPNLAEPYSFACDLDGDLVLDADDTFETTYDLASTFSANGRHIQNSNLVLMSRYRFDVKDSHYEVVNAAGTDAVPFDDPETYWFDGPGNALPNGGNPKGWKTVLCTNEGTDLYAPNEEDVALGIGFVQTDECLEDPSNEDPDCVTYEETFTNYWAVTLSQGGKQVKAASVDDDQSADRQQNSNSKHKQGGSHRGKGKHRK